MACIISSVIIVFAVIGAMIFLVFKSDGVSLTPEELSELLKNQKCINVRISGIHRYCTRRELCGKRINRRRNP